MTNSIKKKLFFSFIGIIGSFIIGVKYCSANFNNETFDTYTIGNAVTTESGNYWKTSTVSPNVTNVNCYSGNCADMFINSGTIKEFYATSTSIQKYTSFEFYEQNCNSAGSDMQIRFQTISGTDISIVQCRNGFFYFSNYGTTAEPMATSTFHLVQINYEQALNKIRYKLDNGNWSSYFNTGLNIIQKIAFQSQNVSTNLPRTIDNIQFSDTQLSNQITFVYPVNNSVIKDFTNWNLNYNTRSSTSTYAIGVQYGKTASTTDFTDYESGIPYTPDITQWSITKAHNLTEGTWYAQAFLYENDNLVNYTPQESFLIDNTNGSSTVQTQAQFTLTRPTDAQICAGIDTTTFFGGIVCGFKQLIVWAFYPSQTSTANLNTTFNQLKTAFPFSAYFGITDTVTNALSTATTTGAEVFSVPMLGTGSSTFAMVPILSSSSISNAIGSSNASIIRTSIGFIIWLFFIGLIYITLR